MNVSVAWLRALAPALTEPPEELAARLSLQAVAVDAIEPLGEGLDDVVVARVRSARPHPDADRLTLCDVDADGDGGTIEVVCGAPNVVEGALYPYVPPGGELPGGFKIEKRRIRGVVSHGMLCSEQELGLGRDAAGILRLADDAEAGTPIREALGLPDTRLTLDLTPNRVDLASHVGVARELAPGGVDDVRFPGFGPEWSPAWADGAAAAAADGVRVAIEDSARCPRYLAAIVRGVRVGPSPDWLRARLRAAGSRPINNVVDATNYVLLEMGQPIHAFDLDRLAGSEIRVRPARNGEKLTTLDGNPHELNDDWTVIADAERPVALAGVMGGANSEVMPETTNLLIECASFDPMATRRTAAAAGLSTDASYRFERGIDERGLEPAVRRCVELILAVAGGTADRTAIRVGGNGPQPSELALRPARVRKLLGLRLAPEQIADLLRPLGFETTLPADRGGPAAPLTVRVPTWRRDVTREVDLIEEVARRYGYERFPREPRAIRPSAVPADSTWKRRAEVRGRLEALGMFEARSTPMVSTRRARQDAVALLNPLAATESVLRTDLVPPLLERLAHNFDQGRRDVRLYEIGTVFAASGDRSGPEGREAFLEEMRVAFVATGGRRPMHWSGDTPDLDVWDLSGWLGLLGETLADWELRPLTGPGRVSPPTPSNAEGRPGFDLRWLGDDRFAMFVAGDPVGFAGRVAASAIDVPPWAGPVFGAEFRLDAVAIERSPRYEPRPAYPAVARDLALVTAHDLAASDVSQALRAAGPAELVAVRPFDVYVGAGLEEDRRSVAWRLVFRAADRTLTDDEVDDWVRRIVSHLTEELDVRVRDA